MGSLDESYPIRDAERLFSFDSTNRPVEMHIYQEEQEDNTKNNEVRLNFNKRNMTPKQSQSSLGRLNPHYIWNENRYDYILTLVLGFQTGSLILSCTFN